MVGENVTDFREFLIRYYEQCKVQDPAYTFRKYAQHLQTSPQKLNQVLKGKSGLSLQAAKNIASKIQLTSEEEQIFIALVESKHSRSKLIRQNAAHKLHSLQVQSDFDEISKEDFSPISEWFYMAACILVDLKDFQADMEWIAQRLGISEEMATLAYDKLFSLGLLRVENGRWVRDSQKFSVMSKTSSAELQRYHKQIISRAVEALEKKPVEERYFASSMISLNQSEVASVKSKLDHFRRDLILSLEKSPHSPDRIFSISIQLHGLDIPGKVSHENT